MRAAVERIEQAIVKEEKILVFGDYDVDGTTAVASMYGFLCKIYNTERIDFYIPHRYREGYGVSKPVLIMQRQMDLHSSFASTAALNPLN